MRAEISEIESQCRLTKNQDLKHVIKEKKKELNQSINTNKREFFDNKIQNCKNKVKTTWNLVKAEVGKNTKNDIKNLSLHHDGKHITDPREISDAFNNFFIGAVDEPVMPNISDPVIENSCGSLKETKFNFVTVSETELENIIQKFENKYSTGYDDIPITVIKQVVPCIIFSKIFEKVVYIKFFLYIEQNNLLDKEQHGFRPGKSTITAAIEFIQSIIAAIDKGDKVIGAFLDMHNAYGSVSHQILGEVLCSLGVAGVELCWFMTYLCDRKQFVEVPHIIHTNKVTYLETICSRLLTLLCGIPQGSIMGPPLFLCYLKGLPGITQRMSASMGIDAPMTINSSMSIYADDINEVISGKRQEDIEVNSHIILAVIKDFLNSKQLLLNSSKSNFISFSTKQSRSKMNPNIYIENEELLQVHSTKFLGLFIDENLSWDDHVNNVIRKTSSGIFALRQMSKLCNTAALKTIYYANIHSHISYGISIYGATTKKNLDKILLQQKRALRIMFNLKRRDSVKHLFAEHGIFTVYALYVFETTKHVYVNCQDSLWNNRNNYKV